MDNIGQFMESIIQAIEDSPGVSVIIALFILWRMLDIFLKNTGNSTDVSERLTQILGVNLTALQDNLKTQTETLRQQTEILSTITGSFKRIESERHATAATVDKIAGALKQHNEQQDTNTTNMIERLDGLKVIIESTVDLIKSLDEKMNGNSKELNGLKPIINVFSERLLKAQTTLEQMTRHVSNKDTKPLSLLTESVKPDETKPAVQVPE